MFPLDTSKFQHEPQRCFCRSLPRASCVCQGAAALGTASGGGGRGTAEVPEMLVRFPKVEIPPNHPFLDGFSTINHPFWETPVYFTHTHWNFDVRRTSRHVMPTHQVLFEGWYGGFHEWGVPQMDSLLNGQSETRMDDLGKPPNSQFSWGWTAAPRPFDEPVKSWPHSWELWSP